MPDKPPTEPIEEFAAIDVRPPLAADDSATAGDIRQTPSAAAGPDEDVAGLRQQRDEYYDLLLRKTAEFDNFRKRQERERRDLTEHANAELLRELLPLVDDLERALGADVGPDAVEAYRRGVEIIHRQILDLLRRRGVTPIEAAGADFDPHYHQAVAREASPDHRDGEVIEVYRRGYVLGTRLLRPAMVKVAKS